MLQQPPNVIQRQLRQPRILVARKQRLALLPQRDVRVHPRPVVPKQRLGHETRRLAVLPRHVLDHILVHHHRVGRPHQRVKPIVYLRLPRRGHLVMLPLNLQPQLLHHQTHLRPKVLLRVGRRHRKIPLLVPNLIPQVRQLLPPRVPHPLLALHTVKGPVAPTLILHVVENEKLRLRPKHRAVGHPRARQIPLGLLRNAPRVPRVALLGPRLGNRAGQRQRRLRAKRIHKRRRRVRHRQHVRRLNALPAPDARPVKPQPLGENLLAQLPDRTTEMLPRPKRVHKLDVEHLRPGFPGHLNYALGCTHELMFPSMI